MTIRPARLEDEAAFLTLRNQQASAFWSGGTVSVAEHRQWFIHALSSPNHHLLVLVDDQDRGVWGYVRMKISIEGRVSFAVDPTVQGKGYGKMLLRALEEGPGVDVLVALVHPANTASVQAFMREGYTLRDMGLQQLVKSV